MNGEGGCGVGAIIRNCDGNTIIVASWKLRCLDDPLVVEAMVVKLGMRFALDAICLNLILEPDALNVIVPSMHEMGRLLHGLTFARLLVIRSSISRNFFLSCT